MLQITSHHTILLAVHPVDFRKGIDGLAASCRSVLLEDPFSGKLFVFTNRCKTAVKILLYDGQGFWLSLKRFSKGKLAWWPSSTESSPLEIVSTHLQIILSQGSLKDVPIPPLWRPIKGAHSQPRLPSCHE
jgi:transposase